MITLALAASLASGSAAGAEIQGNPVCLPVTAQPGHSYPLGTVYVADAGSGTEDITLQATGPWRGQRMYGHVKPFPPSWLHVSYPSVLWIFRHGYVRLGPGQGAYLPVTVTIPPGTPAGDYGGNLIAAEGTSPPAGGAGLGGDAGTDLEIGVGVRPPSCAALTPPAGPATSQQAGEAGAADSTAAAASPHLPGAALYLIILAAVMTGGQWIVHLAQRAGRPR